MTSPIGTPSHWKAEESLTISNKTPTAKIIKRDWTRERPEHITFERLIDYHDRTPQIRMAVASYSEMITGTDMNVTCESEEAQNAISDWIRRTNFYDKFENLVTTILICGNAMLEKLDEKDIQDVLEVDMSTILSKKRDQYGELEWYEQRTQQGGLMKLGENNLDNFIEFNLTSYSRQPWGKSLFYSLAVPRTIGNRTMPPLVEAMWGLEDAMVGIVLNNAYPITTITYNGANDDYLREEARRWQEYKPGDKRVQKVKPEIEFFESAGNSKYTDFVAHLEKTFEIGTQFPHDILTGDFTSRASSETSETIVQKRVRGYQQYLGNKLKHELFDKILMQMGYDVDKENLEVNFTTQNVIKLEVNEVKDFANSGLMSKGEAREWLRANTGMELPDDDIEQPQLEAPEEEPEPEPAQESSPSAIKFAKRYMEIKSQYGGEDYIKEDFGLPVTEATYRGKTVKLNKPFRTPGQSKKFAVYVKSDKGNTKIVRFGDSNMDIKRDDPARRKNFRARHNCDQHKDKTKAGYWSCKMWSKSKVSDIT